MSLFHILRTNSTKVYAKTYFGEEEIEIDSFRHDVTIGSTFERA
jgi:hypothetical protein